LRRKGKIAAQEEKNTGGRAGSSTTIVATKHIKNKFIAQGGPMKKAASAITTRLATGTLLLAGYALIASLPDIRRYIKISTM
jgi:Family of unknown function (DUF6893)